MAITKKQAAADFELLQTVVAATQQDSYIHASMKSLKNLLDSEDVEVNNDIVDQENNPAVRATEKGILKVANVELKEEVVQAEAKAGFKIESGVVMPEASKRVFGRASVYPFDQLEVGQSFFVADSDKPITAKDGAVTYDAFKGLSSTISGANARYAVETGEKVVATKGRNSGKEVAVVKQERKFEQRRVSENGVAGTRVWRVL